uniref:Uncharacterized protein n=1 Tax=Hyaloperonospora arabidopsidis (strain Emoy2) TaxID=559515 RepID=M4BSQ1_HYAAE
MLTDPASTWQHVAVVDPSSTTTSTCEACDGPSLAVCNTATCSSSVKLWFLSQESVPRQWSSASHGRATAPVCDRQPNIALKQRLSVRHARAVAPNRSRHSKTAPKHRLMVRHVRAEASVHTNTATWQRPSLSVPEIPTTPEQRLPVCHERAAAPESVHDEDSCRCRGFRSPSRQQWLPRPPSTSRPEL